MSRGFVYNRTCSAYGTHCVLESSTISSLRYETVTLPLAVPKISCSLLTSRNFDRCVNKHSLFPPQAAVVCVAFARKVRNYNNDSNQTMDNCKMYDVPIELHYLPNFPLLRKGVDFEVQRLSKPQKTGYSST